MSKKQIRYMRPIFPPRIRKRDGESLTFTMQIGLTTEEALLLSEYFSNRDDNAPTVSLIRGFLIHQASESPIDEDKLLHQMAAMYTKKRLAYDLSEKDYNRAMSFLINPPKKANTPKPEIKPKPERRVFIPPTPRKR